MFLAGNCLNFSKKKKKKCQHHTTCHFWNIMENFRFFVFFFLFFSHVTTIFFYFHINFFLLPSVCQYFQLSSVKKKRNRNLYKKLLCRELTGRRARRLTIQKFFSVSFLSELSSMLIFVLYMSLTGNCLNFKKKKSAPYNLPFLKYNGKFPFLCFFFFFTWPSFFFYFHINFGFLPSVCQ